MLALSSRISRTCNDTEFASITVAPAFSTHLSQMLAHNRRQIYDGEKNNIFLLLKQNSTRFSSIFSGTDRERKLKQIKQTNHFYQDFCLKFILYK